MDPTDFSPEFNAKMHELYVNGITPDQVRAHFSNSKNPEHQRWVEQMDRASALEDQDVYIPPQDTAPSEVKRDTSTPLLDTFEKTAQQVKDSTNDMSLGTKLGLGAGAAVLTGVAGAIGNRLLSRVLPTPTERATALQAETYAKNTQLEAERANKANGISPIEQAKVSEILAKIARENDLHQLELEQSKELHQAKLAKVNEKLMKGETIGKEGITLAEPTKGLAELENATGGPLNSATDVELAKIYQAQNAPATPPNTTNTAPVNPANVQSVASQGTPQNTIPVDTNIPGTQNIGQINTKPAVEGGFQVDPANTPNVAQDVKGLENSALTPEESHNKEILTKQESNISPTSEVEGGVRPRTIADIQARPDLNPSLREHLARQEALLAGNKKYHKALAREYESGAKIGPNQVFVPGLGNMDNSMYNTLGAEGRREAMEALKGGQAFGQVKLPGQGFNEQFSKNLEDYSKHLSETIPVDLTTRKSRIAEGLAHTDNYKKLGKVMRIAGVTGLGMAISDLVNAKSIPEAVLRAGDIATDYLPFVGQAKPGLSPKEVGAPTLTPQILEAQRQATLLGSPYRKSKGIKPPER